MANNYLEFSESIEHLTTQELEWWKNKEKETCDAYDEDPEGADENENICSDFSIDKDSKSVWFHADESGNADRVGSVVQQFLKIFRPTESFSLTWAEYCSKPRIGEFGGGAMFVTADQIKFQTCGGWIQHTQKQWENS